MALVFNDFSDEMGVRKTKSQKVRTPKPMSEKKFEKKARIATSELWKKRKGIAIRNFRADKYTVHVSDEDRIQSALRVLDKLYQDHENLIYENPDIFNRLDRAREATKFAEWVGDKDAINDAENDYYIAMMIYEQVFDGIYREIAAAQRNVYLAQLEA